MYCPDELKLNKFVFVRIPKPKDIFARFGNSVPQSSQYSGDESIPAFQSKIDNLAQQMEDYEAFARSEQE